MLTQVPLQPETSRYRHFLIFTALRQVSLLPLKSTSVSSSSMSPTSQ